MDDDESDDDKDEENEKSVVIDGGNQVDSNKEPEVCSGSVTGGKGDGESSAGPSSESGSEEDETICKGILKSCRSPDGGAVGNEKNGLDKPAVGVQEEKVAEDRDLSCLEAAVVSIQAERQESFDIKSDIVEKTISQPPNISNSVEGEVSDVEINCNINSKPVVQEETVSAIRNVSEIEKPLDFDEFNSAVDMEVLGMERLKSELQARGLKCGGTLQERAARLFMLKTTPLEMIPKKLLAKK
ncbi:unnamed protein product [Ilex paraguariensis]|uniref:SDE2/SF3A3 SAP domain-containing protein n=1 Tax=Ilex paraguariensis TaxID=185542 RepID=A0ABC8R671_9AQUA